MFDTWGSTSGLDFRSPSIATLIPSESYRVVHLTGVASQTGTLTIRGVTAQLGGGISREFLLPIHSDEEDGRADRRRSMLNMELGRVKYSGLDAREPDKTQKRLSSAEKPKGPPKKINPTFLACKVVEEQPLLRIRRSTLTHGALMLFEGET